MVKNIEREILSGVPIKVRPEEVVSPLEETPSMVKLDTRQLRKAMLLIFRVENIVESDCCENGSGADGTSDELVALASDEV